MNEHLHTNVFNLPVVILHQLWLYLQVLFYQTWARTWESLRHSLHVANIQSRHQIWDEPVRKIGCCLWNQPHWRKYTRSINPSISCLRNDPEKRCENISRQVQSSLERVWAMLASELLLEKVDCGGESKGRSIAVRPVGYTRCNPCILAAILFQPRASPAPILEYIPQKSHTLKLIKEWMDVNEEEEWPTTTNRV